MRGLIISTLALASVWAQGVTLNVAAPPTARAGETVTVTAALTGTPAAVVYTVGAPAGWGVGTVTSAVPGKQTQCNPGASRQCALFGLTNSNIPAGTVASIPLTIPANAALGPQVVTFSAADAANSAAQPLTVTISSATITVLSLYDLDSNGVVNDQDVFAAVSQAVGVATCGSADFNKDGKCNSIDIVMIVYRGLLGL